MRVVSRADHKFAKGETVSFSPGAIDSTAPKGSYTILLCLPDDGIGFQYKIRSVADSHERVVREQRLTGTGRPNGATGHSAMGGNR